MTEHLLIETRGTWDGPDASGWRATAGLCGSMSSRLRQRGLATAELVVGVHYVHADDVAEKLMDPDVWVLWR
jgi:hypothetical protein